MNVLLVEDSDEKAAAVKSALSATGITVTRVGTVSGAKGALRNGDFSLVVLDLVLPLNAGVAPTLEGGLDVIAYVANLAQGNRPQRVVVLTAYSDALERALQIPPSPVPHDLVHYQPHSDWESMLTAAVRPLVQELVDSSVGAYLTAACIVTAVRDTELQAMLHALPSAQPLEVCEFPWLYSCKLRGQHDILIACAPEQGIASAAVLSARLVQKYRPRFLAMSGITGGISGRTRFGDVILGNPTWDWGSGKWVTENGGASFLPSARQRDVPHDVVATCERTLTSPLLATIRDKWPANKPEWIPRLLVGPSATGASVVADRATLKSIVDQHRKVLGVEMEAFGVYTAAAESAKPRPIPISLKAVSDYADEKKDDDWRDYAAFVSAYATLACLEALLELD